jgi:hypothetical protein
MQVFCNQVIIQTKNRTVSTPMKSAADSGPQKSGVTLSGEINVRRDQTDSQAARPGMVERRRKARIREPFPTNAWGVDARGRAFELVVGLENMSSSGLYLRMTRRLKPGDDLNLRVRFSNGIKTGATALLSGRVLRVEPGVDGLTGVALAIQRYEFI